MELLYVLIIGAVAGWLAGQIMKGGGFGIIVNIILGIVGSVVGNWTCSYFNISLGSGTLGDILTGALGAVIILFIGSLFKK